MSRLKAALSWLVEHWYVPLTFAVGILAFFLGARRTTSGERRTPIKDVRRETAIIEAGRKAKAVEVEAGTEEAVRKIDEEKRETIGKLDDKQAKKLDRLRRNPRARARWLERVGST